MSDGPPLPSATPPPSTPPPASEQAPPAGPAVPPDARLRLRQTVAVVALVVGVSYLTWRALFTLNPDALVFSWFLWVLEAHAIVGVGLAAFSLWDTRPVKPASDELPAGRTAVFITTYNEPVEIVLPTVAAAAELEGNPEVWLLDDGVRVEMRELADRFGVRYLGREDSSHAKAGNLNNALALVDAEFVAVLDADHVPHPQFLRRTLPYFNDPGLAVVQTPQDFYNEDSFEHVPRRGRRRRHPAYTEQSLFYRVIQPGKNRWGAAFWCGTPAVLRTRALRDVGGVATDSVTEDLMTTIRFHRAGWRSVFHNEVLARGLAAPTAEEYTLQRRRWGIGAIQTLRHEKPLTDSRLTWQQRLSYAATFLAWFESVRVIGLLTIPPLVLLTGAAPIAAPLGVFAIWFVAYFTMQLVAMIVLGRGQLRPIKSAMFDLIRLESSLIAVIVGWTGTEREFEVTPKGRSTARRIPVPRLLAGFAGLHLIAAAWYVATFVGWTGLAYAAPGVAHGAAFWALVNVYLLGLAIGRVRSRDFGPERRRSHRHAVRAPAAIAASPAILTDVSMTGAQLQVREQVGAPLTGQMVLVEVERERDLRAELTGKVTASPRSSKAPTVRIDFTDGQLEERARLTDGLFQLDGQPAGKQPKVRRPRPQRVQAAR
jgi:cellulose synthase (UDP-forming)